MRYFGTDGVRGRYGGTLVNESFFKKVSRAVECFFREKTKKDSFKVCIGRDTRESGISLCNAVIDGLSSTTTVLDCGIIPTPAVSENIFSENCDFGFVITASHNPYTDNGIKIFNSRGEKLTVSQEHAIEDIVDSEDTKCVGHQRANVVDFSKSARDNFCRKYKSILKDGSLRGRTILVDSANGAVSGLIEKIFEHSGVNIVHIGNSPNGKNINDGCGSEHPCSMLSAMKGSGAFIGFANDGDGDRVVIFDDTGQVVDGDILIGLIAENLISSGTLPNNTVVVTHQSNLGLDRYIKSIGGDVVRCDVGDRNVYQSMLANNCWFGGESSGHLIFRKYSPIGDGVFAALFVISMVIDSGKKLSEMKTKVALLPKKVFNVSVDRKVPLEEINGLLDDIDNIDGTLPPPHRISIRYSGTEPKLRALIEAGTQSSVDHAWHELSDSIIRRFEAHGISARQE